MHGSRESTGGIRRYQCSTRRHGGDCTQPIAEAEPREAQLVAWLCDFQPDADLRARALAKIQSDASTTNPDPAWRRQLREQLARLKLRPPGADPYITPAQRS